MEDDGVLVFGLDRLSLKSSEDVSRVYHHPVDSPNEDTNHLGGEQRQPAYPQAHGRSLQRDLYLPRGVGVNRGPEASVSSYFPPAGHPPLLPPRYHEAITYPDYYTRASSESTDSIHSQNVAGPSNIDYNFSSSSYVSGRRDNKHPPSLPPYTLPEGVDLLEAEMLLRRANNLSSESPVKLSALPVPPPGEKPTYPYTTLVQLAIWESQNRRLTLQEIYEAILDKFPIFREQGDAWQRSIRHTLSLKKAFVNQGRDRGDIPQGRGAYWELDILNLVGNKRKRKRGASKKTRNETNEVASDVDDDERPPSPRQTQTSTVAGSVDRPVRTRYAQSSSSSRHPAPSRRTSPTRTQYSSSPIHLYPLTPGPTVSDPSMHMFQAYPNPQAEVLPGQVLSPPSHTDTGQYTDSFMNLSGRTSTFRGPSPVPFISNRPDAIGRPQSPRPEDNRYYFTYPFSGSISPGNGPEHNSLEGEDQGRTRFTPLIRPPSKEF
ncbi:hypothetical protein VNI00_010769 [Paramarasmius palmivorus]|uniref:Fork-head domain-containing protein n=1 Tax=Paramarasmius palmivorus TaxID=297713 RepID=A0AAW0CG89_9AGAR